MEQTAHRSTGSPTALLLIPLFLAALLLMVELYDHVLFHTGAELFAVVIAMLVAVVGWQTYPFSRNALLAFIAGAYFWVGGLDLLHALTYPQVNLVHDASGSHTIALWLAARLLEGFALLLAPLFLTRMLRPLWAFWLFGLTSLGMALLVATDTYPEVFIPGEGLTDFKIAIEWLVIALFAGSLVHLLHHRRRIDGVILRLLVTSLVLSIVAEFMFTRYDTIGGAPTIVGHLLKVFSFWCIFVAVVRTGLTQPFRLLSEETANFSAIPDPTLVTALDGTIHHANQAASRLFDLPPEQCVGRRVQDLLLSHCASDCSKAGADQVIVSATGTGECSLCPALERPEPKTGMELAFTDGRWFSLSTNPIRLPDHRMGQVLIAREITAAKRTETALRRSERKYRSLFESSNDALFVHRTGLEDEKYGHFLEVNHVACERLGYSRDELLALDVPAINPDVHQLAARLKEEMRATGHVLFETEHLTRDGRRIPVEVNARVIDYNGAPAVLSVVRDITARVEAQRAVAESERKYRALMTNASDGILVVDERGRIVDGNRQVGRLLGYTHHELLQLEVTVIHPESEQEKLRSCFQSMRDKGYSLCEHLVLRKDGRTASVEVAGARIDLPDRSLFLGIFRDISTRKYQQQLLEQKVADRTRHLESLNRELESFSYSVSHDLRGPLRAINGYSQALIEDCGEQIDELGHGYLGRITAASRQMNELLDGLLSLSRVIRSELTVTRLNLSELAEEIVGLLQEQEPDRQVEVTVEPDLIVAADLKMMRLLLQNLLENAWKFSRHQAVARVRLGTTVHNGIACFYVEDNGIGFAMEDAKKIFEPFERIHSPSEYEGTGIGLATVFRIVRRHGGAMWTHSQTGEGSTFYFTLPNSVQAASLAPRLGSRSTG